MRAKSKLLKHEMLTYIKGSLSSKKSLYANTINGKTEGHIILGTKTPVHQIDEIESWLYFKSDKQEIVCDKF